MKLLAMLAFWFLGIIWGTNFIFMKWGMVQISKLQLVYLRVASGLLPIAMYAFFKKELSMSHLKYWYHFVFMAITSTIANYYCFAKGTDLLPSGIAGAVSGAIPLFAFVVSVLLLKDENITLRKLSGILLGFSGVFVLANPFAEDVVNTNIHGVLYMVFGSLCAGSAFAYTKRFISPLNIGGAALVTYQLGIALLILSFITDFSGLENLTSTPSSFWGVLVGLGLLGTGVAYISYYYIIDKLGAVNASSATYIPPVVALLIGAVFIGEPIRTMDYFATTLVLTGVLMLNRNKHKSLIKRPETQPSI